MKNKLIKILNIVIIIIIIWVSITTSIYAMKNPSKTQTEVFLHIPKSFILKF